MKVTKRQLRKIIREAITMHVNEAGKPLQKLAKGVEARGTKGEFASWCGGHVTQACIDRAAKEGGKRARQASLAVTFSKAKGGGPSLTYPKKKVKEAMLREDNFVSHSFEPGVGDRVQNTNPSCKHFGSQGVVISIRPLNDDMGKVISYECNNDGDTWASGDVLRKTMDQIGPMG